MPIPREPFTDVYLSFPCETCGVAPGKRCITISGAKKNEPHASRAREASEYGWETPQGEYK